MKRLILVDIDGVLLNWGKAFEKHVGEENHPNNMNSLDEFHSQNTSVEVSNTAELIKKFNDSPQIEFVEPYEDSVKYVKKLAELGFRFVTISSSGSSLQLRERRIRNLNKVFGYQPFISHRFVDLFACKRQWLICFNGRGYPWIEDNYGNAKAGLKYGLRPYLIRADHNNHFNLESKDIVNIPAKDSWHHIYISILKYYNIEDPI